MLSLSAPPTLLNPFSSVVVLKDKLMEQGQPGKPSLTAAYLLSRKGQQIQELGLYWKKMTFHKKEKHLTLIRTLPWDSHRASRPREISQTPSVITEHCEDSCAEHVISKASQPARTNRRVSQFIESERTRARSPPTFPPWGAFLPWGPHPVLDCDSCRAIARGLPDVTH